MRLLTTLLALHLVVTTHAILRLGTVNYWGSVSGRVYLIDANTIFLYDFTTTNNVTFSTSGGAQYTLTGPKYNHSAVHDLSADALDSAYLAVTESGIEIARFHIPNNVYVPCSAEYLGRFMRPEGETYHDLDGFVFMDRSQRRFFVAGFNLDNEAPNSFFWLDVGTTPSASGIKTARVDTGYIDLSLSQRVDVNVTFPPEQTNTQYQTLSVWCVQFVVSFGHVSIPTTALDSFTCTSFGPQLLANSPLVHDVTANMYVLGPNTIGLNALSFDGNPPATWYWTGKNNDLTQGYIVRDQLSSLARLDTEISNDNIVLTLPQGTDVCNAHFFSIYCVQASVSFGTVYLGDSFGCSNCPATCKTDITTPIGFECQHVSDTTRIEYLIDTDFITFKFHLCNLQANDYVAVGLSGSPSGVSMVGGDVILCYYTNSGEGECSDYSLTARTQCSDASGSFEGACPDAALGGTDNAYNTQVEFLDGRTTFTTSRKLVTSDGAYDTNISTTESQYIIWSKGGTFEVASGKLWPLRHLPGDRATGSSPMLTNNNSTCDTHFTCSTTPPDPVTPWTVTPLCIDGDSDPIRAYIGNTGASQGYVAITGKAGWGISWYLNGLLVPEVYVLRGTNVTFEVYGGDDPADSTNYHPLYLTSSDEGGIMAGQTTSETVYAGITYSGGTVSDPTTGDYCEWQETEGNGDDFVSWDAYRNTLESSCDSTATPGTFEWVTDANTPDVVYYQCATHRLLGWKIRVVDDLAMCQQLASAYTLLPLYILLVLSVLITLLLGY